MNKKQLIEKYNVAVKYNCSTKVYEVYETTENTKVEITMRAKTIDELNLELMEKYKF
ncbi:hypothetical protein [uncultured Clostridium sp.]|uniref:hypothetical protein n=1 Tax=uncultured Clostridium sp. TaxID=59620 RepID=UPI0026289208|nr:hypothetical protein [uncultured Clostridium sp.]